MQLFVTFVLPFPIYRLKNEHFAHQKELNWSLKLYNAAPSELLTSIFLQNLLDYFISYSKVQIIIFQRIIFSFIFLHFSAFFFSYFDKMNILLLKKELNCCPKYSAVLSELLTSIFFQNSVDYFITHFKVQIFFF